MPAKTHGLSKNCRLYRIWCSMKSRCYAKSRAKYDSYQKKGITVCDEWRNSFLAFQSWAIANGYADNLSIDRIDNDKNYEPANCRWATTKQQARNTCCNVWITFNGEKRLLTDWAHKIGIGVSGLRERIANHGVEYALTTPPHEWEKFVGPDGTSETINGWARRLGLSAATLHERIARHGIKKALAMPNGTCPPKLMELDGVVDSIGGWARRLNISTAALKYRIRRHGVYEALTAKKTGKRTTTLLVHAGIADSMQGWARRLGCSPDKIKWRIRWYGKENAIGALLREFDS